MLQTPQTAVPQHPLQGPINTWSGVLNKHHKPQDASEESKVLTTGFIWEEMKNIRVGVESFNSPDPVIPHHIKRCLYFDWPSTQHKTHKHWEFVVYYKQHSTSFMAASSDKRVKASVNNTVRRCESNKEMTFVLYL